MEHKNKRETRGRKKLPKGEGKTKVVRARVTPAEHREIASAAKAKGKALAAFARSTLLDAARKG